MKIPTILSEFLPPACVVTLTFIQLLRSFANANVKVQVVSKNAPAPGIPPPEIRFLEDENGATENYTLSILDTSNITQESELQHIQAHVEIPLNTSQMTKTELQFYYFKMHDSDNNSKLDGTEIVKSIIHNPGHDETGESYKVFTDFELEEVVDSILQHDDANNDGYIDYYEFKLAQERYSNTTLSVKNYDEGAQQS